MQGIRFKGTMIARLCKMLQSMTGKLNVRCCGVGFSSDVTLKALAGKQRGVPEVYRICLIEAGIEHGSVNGGSRHGGGRSIGRPKLAGKWNCCQMNIAGPFRWHTVMREGCQSSFVNGDICIIGRDYAELAREAPHVLWNGEPRTQDTDASCSGSHL